MEKNEESLEKEKKEEPVEQNEKSPEKDEKPREKAEKPLEEEEKPPEEEEKPPEKKEKPLEKMTAKELREIAPLEIPEIKGVHAMKKEDLLAAIRKARGIEEVVEKEKRVKKEAEVSTANLKKRIREFKALKEEALTKGDARMANIYKRRINRLKKRTRKAA